MYHSGGLWDKKKRHLVSDLVQHKVIILFGLHNKKMTMKVYKKMKKDETVCNTKKEKKSEGITRIEMKKQK